MGVLLVAGHTHNQIVLIGCLASSRDRDILLFHGRRDMSGVEVDAVV
jgi:hypothetical protein